MKSWVYSNHLLCNLAELSDRFSFEESFSIKGHFSCTQADFSLESFFFGFVVLFMDHFLMSFTLSSNQAPIFLAAVPQTQIF